MILTLHDNIVMPQAAQTLEGARHRVLHGVGHMALVHANQVRPHLAEASRILDEAGRTYTVHVHVGLAAEVIVRVAGDLTADLVVMGTHGRSGIAGLVLGSVANQVLQQSPCPVLLVK